MSRLSEHLETVAKAVALVAAGGYIAHRAHLNRLGIPSSTPLNAERYLAEAWYMVSESTELFLRLAFPALLAATLVALIVRFFLSRLKLPFLFRWRTWLEDESERLWLACATAVVLVFLIGNLWLPPTFESPVIIGPLNAGNLHGPGDLGSRGHFATALTGWALAVGAVTWLARRSAPDLGIVHGVWLACRVLLVLGLLGLCLQFGTNVRDGRYPKVELVHGKEKDGRTTLSGLLVLESADSLFIWRPVPPSAPGQGSPSGETLAIPRGEVFSVRFGTDTDVFSEACLAAGGTFSENTDSSNCLPMAGVSLGRAQSQGGSP